MIYISLLYRYWKTHTKNLILIVFSGAFFFASIMVVFLLFRNKMSEKMNAWYDYKGAYNCSYVEGEYNEILNDYIDCLKKDAGNIEGRIYVTEKKSKNDMEYTCGYLEDRYDLAHIPMEVGRLPEKENEVAIDRIALENWGWLGEVGDTIVFDDGSRYVVSGIIDEQYGKRRRTEVCEWIEDYYNFGYEDLSKVKTFPLVYFYNDEKEPLYSIVMLGGIDRTESGEETQSIIDGLIEKCGMDYYKSFIEINQHFSDAKYFSKQNDITLDGNWALIIIGIASIIAVLSLASVLFVVKKEKTGGSMVHIVV